MQSTIDQIYTLNNLLALLAGSDRSVTREMRRAIRFAAQNISEGAKLATLSHCARQLTKLHWRGRSAALLHCDLSEQTHEPLWLRSQVLDTLKAMPPAKDAVLLVSGLRDSIASSGRRWTHKRENEYSAARTYLEELCASEQPFGTRLNVIFL